MPGPGGTDYRFFGTYECEVLAINDEESPFTEEECPEAGVGWIKVKAPRFMGSKKVLYCRPKTHFAGINGVGGLLLGSIGSTVHVDFIAGDSGMYPVWTHGGWKKRLGQDGPAVANRKTRVLYYDENGSYITVTNEGDGLGIAVFAGDGDVTVTAKDNITIKAEKNVTINGGKKVQVSASGSVNVVGREVVTISAPRISLN